MKTSNHPAYKVTTSATRYEVKVCKFWQLKKECQGLRLPKTVSLYGSLPSVPSAYEVVESGFSILDNRNGTSSNYFFGKVGIETEAEAKEIIQKLLNR